MDFKGTESEKNIELAFIGESMARNRYTYYAQQAAQEGKLEISEIYENMATNEREHAKVWFKLMNGGLGELKGNLQSSAKDENDEWASMYPKFSATARKEGFEDLAIMFERVAAIEKAHELKLLETLIGVITEENSKKGSKNIRKVKEVSKTPKKKSYRCMFCGNTQEYRQDVCPLCSAIGSYEELK